MGEGRAVPDERYWDREIETMPRDQLRRLQEERLARQLDYVFARSPFYRRKFAAAGIRRDDIRSSDDLQELPFTTKQDLRESLELAPPYGDYLAVPLEQTVRLHTSSGTTGRPTPMFWTRADLDRWSDLYARSGYQMGIRAHDVHQNAFNYSWFVGGLGAQYGFERIGCTVIPAGVGESRRQIETMVAYRSTVLTSTISFAFYLAETARELGYDPAQLPLRILMVGGEPGGSVPQARARLEALWNARVYDGYGTSEFQPVAWECEQQRGLHICEDFVFVEVCDPDTGERVPPGEKGVLVLTHLDRQACPLVRWWTGDIACVSDEPCPCGRTHRLIPGGILGRADDMLIVKGVNLFPSAVEDVLRGLPEIGTEYQIILDRDVTDPNTGGLQAIKLRIEHDPAAISAEAVAHKVAAEIRSRLTVRALVEAVPLGTLPRTQTKAQRVIRLD
ncbi:MAG TPA: phenylacetate--CoA ligase [Bacillota bacterium]